MLQTDNSTWESRLIARAQEAHESHFPYNDAVMSSTEASLHPAVFELAYQYCDQLTKSHSRTFYLASQLLPPDKRQAVRALYAFCRVSDNLVDNSNGDGEARLAAWRDRSLHRPPQQSDLVAVAWTDVRRRYHVPMRYAEQLLDGVARDIRQTRYQTFDDLANYSYGVASTVGLMAMHIIGYDKPEAVAYAVKLGIALQLTNILRDIDEDWRSGRLYLPLEELEAFGLREGDIAAWVENAGRGRLHANRDERWQAFMQFQVERNRRLYAEALPGVALLHPDGRFAIQAAGELYRAILKDIEANRWNVFGRRAQVDAWGKVRRLPGIWWRAR